MRSFIAIALLLCSTSSWAECANHKIVLQILGSGGPELIDQRASSSYLIWLNDKATIIVDTGSGSALNFNNADANFNDVKAILFTHLHVDHSADLPALIKSSFFSGRTSDLMILGPDKNLLMPSTQEFVQRLFSNNGAYPYLQDYVNTSGRRAYHIDSRNVSLTKPTTAISIDDNISVSATPVHHGPIAAVAWRIDIDNCSLTFSGDMSNRFGSVIPLAMDSDILVAHNAIPEGSTGVARNLHMPPSEIGKIAQQAKVKKLVLSHRMRRTLGTEKHTLHQIKSFYKGPVEFANDLDRYNP